ncbi:MAG: peptidylprolyl isomerase, partial [Candidatus Thermoplasmatota archaeon]|nr:peptidylprolyl isomerase [Candidatus Thermoplasmatota archaeon]
MQGKNRAMVVVMAICLAAASLTLLMLNNGYGPLGAEAAGNSIVVAVIDTNMGTIRVELYPDKMPNSTANFIKLAEDDFYDGLVFHRVVPGFVIQGGGFYPNATYKESPYGTIAFESHPDVTHVDGALSMARGTSKDSATSQFFICDGPQPQLDGEYAAFG